MWKGTAARGLVAWLGVGAAACASGELVPPDSGEPGIFQATGDAASSGLADGTVPEAGAGGSSSGGSSGSAGDDSSGGTGSSSSSSGGSASSGSGSSGAEGGGATCVSCNGCCDSTGTCQPGDTTSTCGAAGGPCADCTLTSQTCAAGACVSSSGGSSSSSGSSSGSDAGPCGQRTCNQGCCDTSGTCQPGTATAACGLNGQRCMDCTNRGLNHMCGPPNLHNLCL